MNRPQNIHPRMWRAVEDSGRLGAPTVGAVRRRAGMATGVDPQARVSLVVALAHRSDPDGLENLPVRLHRWAINRGATDVADRVLAEHEAHRLVQAEVARHEAAVQLEGTFLSLHRGQDPARIAQQLEQLAGRLRAASPQGAAA